MSSHPIYDIKPADQSLDLFSVGVWTSPYDYHEMAEEGEHSGAMVQYELAKEFFPNHPIIVKRNQFGAGIPMEKFYALWCKTPSTWICMFKTDDFDPKYPGHIDHYFHNDISGYGIFEQVFMIDYSTFSPTIYKINV